MARSTRSIDWFVAALALWAVGAVLAQAATNPPPSAAAENARSSIDALIEIRDEIAFLQARLSQLDVERSGLKRDLERLDLELLLGLERLREATLARDLAQLRLDMMERRVTIIERDLGRLRDRIQGGLRALYGLGRRGYLRFFFAVKDQEALLPAMRQIRYFVLRDTERLRQFRDRRVELEFESRELASEKTRYDGWVTSERQRRQELFELQKEKLAVLQSRSAESSEVAATTGRLAEKERRLSRTVDLLYGRSRGLQKGTPIQQFKGGLEWPVRGRVVTGFGPRTDPRYRTLVPHNGVDLAVPDGSGVQVVFPGKVLYADLFEGYGLTVIVEHPGNVFSLYAHLQELSVLTGDVVSLGNSVGLSGSRFYFEIREENSPQDPLLWLR